MTPVLSIVGRSNTGKTTLIEGLIRELQYRGYKIATMKHSLHGFDIDRRGKDSWRHRAAGSVMTILSSPSEVVSIESVEREQGISELSERFVRGADIILSEGFKGNPFPKIEIFRMELGQDFLCTVEDHLIAVAGNSPVERGVPYFDRNDYRAMADLIELLLLKPHC